MSKVLNAEVRYHLVATSMALKVILGGLLLAECGP